MAAQQFEQNPIIHHKNFGRSNLVLVVIIAIILSYLFWIEHGAFQNNVSFFSFHDNSIFADANGKNISNGAVLGASTVNSSLLDAVNSLQINTNPDNSIAAIKNYVQQLNVVMVNDSNSSPDKYLQDLSAVAAPEDLKTYAKLFISDQVLTMAALQPKHDSAIDGARSIVEQQLQPIRSEYAQAGVQLP